jgi:hypothetical protein
MASFVLKKTAKFSVFEIPSVAPGGVNAGSVRADDSTVDDTTSPASCLHDPDVHRLWSAMEEARQAFSMHIGLLQVETLAHNALEANFNAALFELHRSRARDQDAFYEKRRAAPQEKIGRLETQR